MLFSAFRVMTGIHWLHRLGTVGSIVTGGIARRKSGSCVERLEPLFAYPQVHLKVIGCPRLGQHIGAPSLQRLREYSALSSSRCLYGEIWVGAFQPTRADWRCHWMPGPALETFTGGLQGDLKGWTMGREHVVVSCGLPLQRCSLPFYCSVPRRGIIWLGDSRGSTTRHMQY